MKKGQLLGISIAAVAGLGAFVLMRGVVNQPVRENTVEVRVDATEVLVAASAIDLGATVSDGLFRWQAWPKEAVSPNFITKDAAPETVSGLNGSVVRSPFLAGEPITSDKLIKPGTGGVLAAILPAGMRAVSTKISEASAAGRLILPNDHVDVIVIRRVRDRGNQEQVISDTLFRNIRVLAIGQLIQNKEGEKSAAAETATLELTPQQAETLAQANSVGEISLALRSIADIPKKDKGVESIQKKREESTAVKILRYGNRSQASGVN